MKEKGIGKIATLSGRFFAMDRDKRWQRVQKAYDAMVKGEGVKATSAEMAIEASYQKEVFDEFVEPTVLYSGDKPVAKIEDNDSVIFFNFRPDRAREITRATRPCDAHQRMDIVRLEQAHTGAFQQNSTNRTKKTRSSTNTGI